MGSGAYRNEQIGHVLQTDIPQVNREGPRAEKKLENLGESLDYYEEGVANRKVAVTSASSSVPPGTPSRPRLPKVTSKAPGW